MNRFVLCATGLTVLVVAGCGGRTGDPVSRYQPGDENRSCQGLNTEIANNEDEMERLLPHKDATGKNVVLGVAGAFVLVPWFFMDFKEGEAIELRAFQRRNEWLREVATDKGCDVPPARIVFEDKPEQPPTRRKACC